MSHSSNPGLRSAVLLISTLLMSGVLFGGGCKPDGNGSAAVISEEEFVELYGRLLLWREYQTSRSSSPNHPAPDSVSAAEVDLLRRYIEETDYSTQEWVVILTRANEWRESLRSALEQDEPPPPTSG